MTKTNQNNQKQAKNSKPAAKTATPAQKQVKIAKIPKQSALSVQPHPALANLSGEVLSRLVEDGFANSQRQFLRKGVNLNAFRLSEYKQHRSSSIPSKQVTVSSGLTPRSNANDYVRAAQSIIVPDAAAPVGLAQTGFGNETNVGTDKCTILISNGSTQCQCIMLTSQPGVAALGAYNGVNNITPGASFVVDQVYQTDNEYNLPAECEMAMRSCTMTITSAATAIADAFGELTIGHVPIDNNYGRITALTVSPTRLKQLAGTITVPFAQLMEAPISITAQQMSPLAQEYVSQVVWVFSSQHPRAFIFPDGKLFELRPRPTKMREIDAEGDMLIEVEKTELPVVKVPIIDNSMPAWACKLYIQRGICAEFFPWQPSKNVGDASQWNPVPDWRMPYIYSSTPKLATAVGADDWIQYEVNVIRTWETYARPFSTEGRFLSPEQKIDVHKYNAVQEVLNDVGGILTGFDLSSVANIVGEAAQKGMKFVRSPEGREAIDTALALARGGASVIGAAAKVLL